jgi:hypothetical protein
MVDELDMHLMRLAIIFLLSLASCAQQSRLNPPEDEREAIRECDRVVFGETNEKRMKSGYVYDTLFKRWLIDERADEIVRASLSGTAGLRRFCRTDDVLGRCHPNRLFQAALVSIVSWSLANALSRFPSLILCARRIHLKFS